MVFAFLALGARVEAQTATAQQYYQAGNQLYSAGKYAQAAQYYGTAIKVDPHFALAYQGIGNCYYVLGNKPYALAYFQKSLQLNPNNSQLSGFVQSLQAQAGGTGAASTPGATPAANPLAQGTVLFQQKQYAQALPYFQQAIQQNPNNYQGYYYAGYCCYMTQDLRNAALYLAVANQKQPSPGVKGFADQVRAKLSPSDQQWVDSQVAQLASVKPGAMGAASSSQLGLGVRLLGGVEYVLSDPYQLKTYTAAATNGLDGNVPNLLAVPGIEAFYQLSPNFEIDLGGAFAPPGALSYTWSSPAASSGAATYSYSVPVTAYQDTLNVTTLTGSLGLRLLLGDSKFKFYIGGGADLSSVSIAFNKIPIDTNGSSGTADSASGNYGTVAFGGHGILGADFFLTPNIGVGPYVGYRYLAASNFLGNGTLVIDNTIGPYGGDISNGTINGTLIPSRESTTPLILDLSGVTGGINVTFSF